MSGQKSSVFAAIGAGLEYLLNPCADLEDILSSAALGAVGAAFGGSTMIKIPGKEFSHFIPKRLLPKFLKNTKLNGNYVTPKLHSQTDPFRLLKGQKKLGKHLYPRGIRQIASPSGVAARWGGWGRRRSVG